MEGPGEEDEEEHRCGLVVVNAGCRISWRYWESMCRLGDERSARVIRGRKSLHRCSQLGESDDGILQHCCFVLRVDLEGATQRDRNSPIKI